jgi:outer membrane murein-binding lipoprotein Lpp
MGAGTVLRVRRAYALVLASIVLAGCGASDGSRLTREQYASKADAVCQKYKQKSDALSSPTTLPALASVADRLLPLLNDARRELRALRPPAREQATANAWLDAFDVSIDDVRKIRDRAKAGDRAGVGDVATRAQQHNGRANELAAQLGMTVCSKN